MTAPKKVDPAKKAHAALSKMTDDERRSVRVKLQRAIAERDLPRFQAQLAKLGIDETSVEYQKLMELWHEHARASHR
jgi:hypothetical protein